MKFSKPNVPSNPLWWILLFCSILSFTVLPGALSAQEDVSQVDSVVMSTEDQQAIQSSEGIEPELSYWEATLLGVVEGLTEYLPVSSTGHLILVDRWLDSDSYDTPKAIRARDARNAYLVVIQGGAILAVMFLYWRKLLRILMGLLGKDPKGLRLGLKVLVAFIPAALIGPFLNDLIESKLFNAQAVAAALIIGALVMWAVEWKRKRALGNAASIQSEDATTEEEETLEQLTFKGALFVGVMQCLAMWPGMSRSMVTIVGGYLTGLSSRAAAEFSFLLGFLTLSAASAYSLLKSWDVMVDTLTPGSAVWGIVVATVVAFLAVKWFVSYLTKHGLVVFAVYRILLAVVVLWFMR